jgi:drug/metabolite transporter (DMT)-like permease
LEVASGQSFEVRPATAAALAYYGIFPSVFAYLCFNRGVALLGHTKAGIFIHLVPVFGVILSAVLIGELPHVYHIAGMALVFGGIWLSSTARPQLAAIASEP